MSLNPLAWTETYERESVSQSESMCGAVNSWARVSTEVVFDDDPTISQWDSEKYNYSVWNWIPQFGYVD